MSINNCVFKGRIKSKRMESTTEGKAICLFTLELMDQEKRSDFVDAVAYSTMAEIINRDFHIGHAIGLICRVHSYKKDGTIKHNFIVEKFDYDREYKRPISPSLQE